MNHAAGYLCSVAILNAFQESYLLGERIISFDRAETNHDQSIILFSNVGYRKAAIRLVWTYNELIKCETKIKIKIKWLRKRTVQ